MRKNTPFWNVSRLQMTEPDTINHLTDFKDKIVDPVTKANYPWILHLVDRMNATWVNDKMLRYRWSIYR